MTIQPIGATSAALYITAADLEEQGLTSGDLTLEQALSLTRAAFTRAGLTLAGGIEIEAFPDQCGVLVFVHLTPPQRRWITFENLDDLLSALPLVPREVEGAALYHYDGWYYLALPIRNEAIALRLTEFGAAQQLTPLQEASLMEHGDPVAVGGLFSRFRRSFRV